MTTPDGSRWADPPRPVPDYRPDWPRIAATLRAHPGRWRLVFTQQRASLATALYLNHVSTLRREAGFEVRTANNTRTPPRLCDLYLRYNPDADTERKD